jgi:hypothetical protein
MRVYMSTKVQWFLDGLIIPNQNGTEDFAGNNFVAMTNA